MKKNAESKRKFIEYRARGMSFDKISEEMSLDISILVGWSQEFRREITNARALGLDTMQEEYCLTPEAQVEMWGQIVHRINQELASRDLSDVSTDKLLNMLAKAQERLEAAYGEPDIKTVAQIRREKEEAEMLANLLQPLT
jgi:hypothetical protein